MNQAITKAADEKFCADCGAIIKQRAEICPKCGVRQMAAPGLSVIGPVTGNGKNKLVAALCALFLGSIGIHKFYLGNKVQGVLYLIFFWTFIPAILGFVDAIRLLLMSEQNFAQAHGTS